MVWVGEDGMSFVWDCVACCIGAYPTSPSSPPALRSGAGANNGFDHHDTPWTCSVLSVPTWMVFHSRSLSRLPTASPSTLPF